MRILLVALVLLPLFAPAAPAQVVRGRVLDAAADAPIVGATVRVPQTPDDAHATRTDTLGRFRLQAPRDSVLHLEASAPGYRTAVTSLAWRAHGDSVEVILRLAADTVLLEPLEVVAAGRRRSAQVERFYARARDGAQGWFVTREQIRTQGAMRTTDLLRRARGIRLVETRGGTALRGRGACIPAVFLDGLPISPNLVDHWIRPDALEGIEVYTAGAAPAEYQHRRNVCALVLLWTHHD